MSATTRAQLDINRRCYTLAGFDTAGAIVLYLVLGFPRSLPLGEAPLGLAFTAVVAAQDYWRINSRNTFRRTFISLNGIPIVMAAFYLPPGWFVVMLVIGPRNRSNPVVGHLIALGDDLGLDVVAEGIEAERERDMLFRLGCDRGQGYLLARPMSPSRAADWITANHPHVDDQPVMTH